MVCCCILSMLSFFNFGALFLEMFIFKVPKCYLTKHPINLFFSVVGCTCNIHVFNRVIPCQIMQNFWIMSPLSHGFFFEIFTSSRYHRDMKALKILASISKHFRIYVIFKNSKLVCLGWHFKYNLYLVTSVSNNLWSWKFTGVCFWLKKFKATSKLP